MHAGAATTLRAKKAKLAREELVDASEYVPLSPDSLNIERKAKIVRQFMSELRIEGRRTELSLTLKTRSLRR